MVTIADVLNGVKSLWLQKPISRAVPGGLHHGQVRDDSAGAYATVMVTEGERQETSGRLYLAPFTVQITVWSEGGTADAGTVARLLDAAFTRTTGLAVPGADGVVMVKPLPGRMELDPAQKDANDVVLAGGQWLVVVQVTR